MSKKQDNTTALPASNSEKSVAKIINRTSRYFSLISYCSARDIEKILANHRSSIRAYAYIYHNADEVTPHFHILIRTLSSWKPLALCKWFSACVDDSGAPVNTFCEIASSIDSLVPYILHETEESIADGKHRYDKSEIISYRLFDLKMQTDSFDSSYEVVKAMILGVPARELVRRYGRDYVYHFNAYQAVVDKIVTEEDGLRIARSITLNETSYFEEVSADDPLPF